MISILLRTFPSDDPGFFILVIVIAVGILIYSVFFSNSAIVKRKLRKAGGKRISEFQNEEVAKIIGAVRYVGEPLRAPLSGRLCAYYHILVEERRSTGKNSHWFDLINEEVSAHVVLKDGNHYAYVLTKSVKSALVEDVNYRSGFLEDATEPMEKYLEKHGHKSVSWIGLNKTIRYTEGILEEGELVAVLGKGIWKKKSDFKIAMPSERILVIGPTDEHPVYFSDHPDVADRDEGELIPPLTL